MKMRSISIIESIFFTTLTIFLMFNIKYKLLPPTFFIASLVLIIMAIYYSFKNYKFPSVFIKPIFFYTLFVISTIISAFVSENFDLFLFSIIITIFFLITVVPYVYLSYFKNREIEIIKYIVYAGIVNAVFIIGMFLSSDFKLLYLSMLENVDLIHTKGEGALNSLYALRLVGLTGSATYGMAVVQVIMAFLYVYYVRVTFYRFRLLNYFILSILLISAIISGRTAFIGIALLLIFMFLVIRKIDFFKFIILFLISSSMLLIMASIFLPENFYSFFESWILQLFKKGEKIGSLEANINMYIYGFNDFSLFGDFKWFGDETRTSYYMSTDVGWYRFLFAFGYIGIGIFLIFLFSLIKFSNKINNEMLLSFFIIVFLLIVMIKGAILFDFYIVFFVLTILYFIISRTRQ